MRNFANLFSRFALFVIYSWFGALKVLGELGLIANSSPANPLVNSLLAKTLPFVTFHQFIIFLGAFEVILGILFLIPRAKWIAFALFVIHMIICTGPLLLLPAMTWQSAFIPTLEGQYIIKNLALIAVALNLTFD